MPKGYYILLLVTASLVMHHAEAQTGKNYLQVIKKHRKAYKKDFLKTPNAPLDRKGVKSVRFFEPNPVYRVTATFEPVEYADPFDMATYAGTTQPYATYGVLHFDLNGAKHELTVYRSLRLQKIPGYEDYLFLPFKDLTNGESTYGGGRYLDFRTGDIDNFTLILDFNKSYNPYCAYSDGYQCPIPPEENDLNIAIPAGERAYEGGH
ncbi:MAG: hypothetical protein DHS20C18_20350 [Saprospiraceae bacterium]|nr:MAG: hypothetical protein DHS20C18_20350 [Saprospiraceae bacterium]